MEITENEVICKHLEWQKLPHSKDCIAQLLQHQEPHNCTYATATYETNVIQQIKDNNWIAILKQEEVIKTICGNDVQYQRNKGVLLITINSNCRIQIMDKTIMTHERYVNIRETIPLPRAHQTPRASPIVVNLENINLDNLKNAIKQSEEIQVSEDNNAVISSKPSWSSITLYIIIVLTGTGIAIYIFWWIPKSALTSAQQPEAEELQHRSQPSARLHLKGGGVMSL